MLPRICPLCLRTMQRIIRCVGAGRTAVTWWCEHCIYSELDG